MSTRPRRFCPLAAREAIEQALDAHIRSWLDERLWRQRDREIDAPAG